VQAVRLTCAAPPNFVDAEGHVWQARASALIVSGGYAEAAPRTVIAGAGGLQPVFLAECSGSLALSLPAPVDAHYDVTLLAARARSLAQRSRRSRPLRTLATYLYLFCQYQGGFSGRGRGAGCAPACPP